MSIYNEKFYDSQEQGSLRSAREILPIVLELINPASVIDVGCGLGTWLSVFIELGVKDILGLDGDWVNEDRLHIPKKKFIATDLENPIVLHRKFDLTISLEVAEHITKENSESFIKYLINQAPVILFSAAIPLQGGTNHINEQLPDYWIKIFQENGYQVIDCIRSKIWENENIDVWYIQNIFLFVEKNYLSTNEKLKKEQEKSMRPYSIVHPNLYVDKIKSFTLHLENQKKGLINELNVQKQVYEEKLSIQRKNHEKEIKFKEELIKEMESSNSWKFTNLFRKLGKWIRNL